MTEHRASVLFTLFLLPLRCTPRTEKIWGSIVWIPEIFQCRIFHVFGNNSDPWSQSISIILCLNWHSLWEISKNLIWGNNENLIWCERTFQKESQSKIELFLRNLMKLAKHDRYCFYITTVFYYMRMLFVFNASLDTGAKLYFFIVWQLVAVSLFEVRYSCTSFD